MRASITRLIAVFAIVALPIAAHAQEATLGGTVTDTTGGVLPGVTVTATHPASGNTFVAVTDQNRKCEGQGPSHSPLFKQPQTSWGTRSARRRCRRASAARARSQSA